MEDAARIAEMIVGEEEYREIKDSYDFALSYEALNEHTLIELTVDVVNGEHEDLDTRFSYDSEEWSVEDFVEMCDEWSSTPFSSRQKHSEMRGTTQVGDEPITQKEISENQTRFISAHMTKQPRADSRHALDPDVEWVELTYLTDDENLKYNGPVTPVEMEDFVNPTEDAETREDVYWPGNSFV